MSVIRYPKFLLLWLAKRTAFVRRIIGIQYLWDFFTEPAPQETQHNDLELTQDQQFSWGWFPLISFMTAVCLLMIAIGFSGARQQETQYEGIFWLGLVGMYAVVAYRIIALDPSRRERLALLLLLGISLYLVKVMHSPIYFTFYDELQHFRTTVDIIETNHLFKENPLLPVSPLYPGLENITVAFVNLSGVDIFTAGVFIILIARSVFMLVLFLFFEKASQSPRLASIATIIYAANPHFIFFDAQYGYESMAIVFAVMVFFGLEYRLHQYQDRPIGATLLIILGMGMTMITHHVTSYFLLFCLILWTSVYYVLGNKKDRSVFFGTLALAIVFIISWMMYVASITIDYLVPVLSGAVFDLIKVILREESGRVLFSGQGEQGVRFYEQIIVYFATIFILLGIMIGGIVMWRQHRRQPTYVLLGIIGLLYPVTQLLRFSSRGPEIASRIGPFMFIGIAFVMAIGVLQIYPAQKRNQIRQFVLTAIVVTIFWGDVLVSFPRWALLPGEYLVSADTRSIENKGIDTAVWVRAYLDRGKFFAADRINSLLMTAYGLQEVVTGAYAQINVAGIFLSAPFTPTEYKTLCEGDIEYIVLDYRLTEQLPMLDHYYDVDELKEDRYRRPLEPSIFKKFDIEDHFSRIYDNGDLVIFHVDLSNCGS